MNIKEIEKKYFEDFEKLLNTELSDIYKLYKKERRVFYRGTKPNINFFKKIFIKDDRRPKDTKKEIHDFLNQIFDLAGFPVNRSNGVFVTGNIDFAKSFGNPYVFFPKNGYKFLWSEQIYDFSKDVYLELITNYNVSLYKPKKESNPGWSFFILGGDVPESDLEHLRYYYIIEENKRKEALEELKKIILNKYPKLSEERKKLLQNAEEISTINYNFGFSFASVYSNLYDDIVSWAKKYAKKYDIFSEKNKKDLVKTVKKLYKTTDIRSALISGNEVIFRSEYYYLAEINFVKNFFDFNN